MIRYFLNLKFNKGRCVLIFLTAQKTLKFYLPLLVLFILPLQVEDNRQLPKRP